MFYFHPYLGKIPILTNIFQRGGSTTNYSHTQLLNLSPNFLKLTPHPTDIDLPSTILSEAFQEKQKNLEGGTGLNFAPIGSMGRTVYLPTCTMNFKANVGKYSIHSAHLGHLNRNSRLLFWGVRARAFALFAV